MALPAKINAVHAIRFHHKIRKLELTKEKRHPLEQSYLKISVHRNLLPKRHTDAILSVFSSVSSCMMLPYCPQNSNAVRIVRRSAPTASLSVYPSPPSPCRRVAQSPQYYPAHLRSSLDGEKMIPSPDCRIALGYMSDRVQVYHRRASPILDFGRCLVVGRSVGCSPACRIVRNCMVDVLCEGWTHEGCSLPNPPTSPASDFPALDIA